MEFSVPALVASSTNVQSFKMLASGEGTVVGLGGDSIAKFSIKRSNGEHTFQFQSKNGHPITAKYSVSRGTNGSAVISGLAQAKLVKIVVSQDGNLLENPIWPDHISSSDSKIFWALSQTLLGSKLDIPQAKANLHRGAGSNAMPFGTITLKHDPTPIPLVDVGGCAVGFLEVVVSTACCHPLGVAFGAAGMFFACF